MTGKGMLFFWLCAALATPWTLSSFGEPGPPQVRQAAMELPSPAGVDAGRWQRVIGQLKANGLSAVEVRECLAPVQEAARQGLPSDPVLTRVEEGTAKGVGAGALQEAGKQRLANLQSAAKVLRGAGYDCEGASQCRLMASATLAMESGLSSDTLQAVLAPGGGRECERMRTIIEAGESMRLNGVDESTVRQLMTDFVRRNMRRMEVIRASRFVVQQHSAHVEGSRIRQQLWDGARSGWSRGGGASISAASGPGPVAGGPSILPGNVRAGAGPGGEPLGEGSSGSGGRVGQGGNEDPRSGPRGPSPNQGQ